MDSYINITRWKVIFSRPDILQLKKSINIYFFLNLFVFKVYTIKFSSILIDKCQCLVSSLPHLELVHPPSASAWAIPSLSVPVSYTRWISQNHFPCQIFPHVSMAPHFRLPVKLCQKWHLTWIYYKSINTHHVYTYRSIFIINVIYAFDLNSKLLTSNQICPHHSSAFARNLPCFSSLLYGEST